ncbi:hypothetical protein CCHR01_15517 [Colletotrichum chrysophilum]|uniref:Uncharacterized protein n=1 Tax=Colletotrichum chrysophilum TaxID=1836956 RepID=A0AAD9A6H9_9PEZI|nr:hypothetical protein CCHR01_15517 [Colletotrichum chrysophilum]
MSQMLGPLFLAIVAAPGTREERQRSPATSALQVQCPRVRVPDFPGDERLPPRLDSSLSALRTSPNPPPSRGLSADTGQRYRNYTPSRFNSPSIAGISLKGGAVTRPDASVSRMLSLPVRLL